MIYFDNWILSWELQLWQRWCNISPLWQPSIGNATHVEYSNNWNLPLQRSLPLQKLIGHYKTTLWSPYVYFGIRDWLHKTPARQLAQISSLTILRTPTRSLQLHCHGNFMPLMATGDSLTDVLVARICTSCLMQLVSNPKVNLSEPLSLQFVCNQGNHSVVKTGHR